VQVVIRQLERKYSHKRISVGGICDIICLKAPRAALEAKILARSAASKL
jgi:hypothetical protein